MMSSGSSSSSAQRVAAAVLLLCALLAAGCVDTRETPTVGHASRGSGVLVAVFPVENLSGRPAPLDDVRHLFTERLRDAGFRVLDDATLERIITRHRVRYTAGIEAGFARALKDETGADAVVIPSLELYDAGAPPRVALFARLVSTGDTPTVRWIDGMGSAGHDAPGILGIGLVDDARVLIARAVDAVAASLASSVPPSPRARAIDVPARAKFRPKLVYRAEAFDPERSYSIAVAPFFDKTPRKHAGEIVALHMMRSLVQVGNLAVVEPGIVREQLLRFRIIMIDGVSLADTDTIANAVTADLVLNGEVLAYHDADGPYAVPRVDFSVLFIERKSRRVLYSSYSHNAGDDRVFFFGVGRVNTAHAVAARMARAITERMLFARSPRAMRE